MPRVTSAHVLVLIWLASSTCQAAPAPPAAEEVAELQDRRGRVLERLAAGELIVVQSGERIPPPLRGLAADPDFLYLVGIAQEEMVLVLEGDGQGDGTEILFLRPADPRRARWDGWRLAPGEQASSFTGIVDTRSRRELEGYLREAAARASRVRHNLPVARGEDPPTGLLALLAAPREGAYPPWTRDGRLRELTGSLRQVKSPAEVARMQQAATITCSALRRALGVLEPGLREYQLQAVIEATFRWEGAEDLAFRSIVATGANGIVLHHRAGEAEIQAGDLVLMDVGCQYRGYCADVTRTAPATGRFTPRQRELYDLVLEAQAAALAEVRPGGTLALMQRAAQEVLTKAGLERGWRHGIGHWLGLSVHDVSGGEPGFQPGMVLTVEPGIYLEEEGIGIRIEDDVLVTVDGCRLLTAVLPRTADEIEALMRERSVPPAGQRR